MVAAAREHSPVTALKLPDTKIILSTAFTGVRYHPDRLRTKDGRPEEVKTNHLAANMPITSDEVARDAAASYREGSRYMHIHARNPITGKQSCRIEDYQANFEAIRSAVPGVLLSGPTSRKEDVGNEISSRMSELEISTGGNFQASEVAQVEMARALPAIMGGADFVTMFTEPDIHNDNELVRLHYGDRGNRQQPRRWPQTVRAYFNRLCTATETMHTRHEIEITHSQTLKTVKALLHFEDDFRLGYIGHMVHAVVLLGFSAGLPIKKSAFKETMEELTRLQSHTGLDVVVSVGAVIKPQHAAPGPDPRRFGEELDAETHDYREVIQWVVKHNRRSAREGLLPVSIFRTGLEDTPVLYGQQQTNASLTALARETFAKYDVEAETDLDTARAVLGVDSYETEATERHPAHAETNRSMAHSI